MQVFNNNKNACQLNNDIIYKHLSGSNTQNKVKILFIFEFGRDKLNKFQFKENINITNDKIKSIQALITGCASYYSLNNN